MLPFGVNQCKRVTLACREMNEAKAEDETQTSGINIHTDESCLTIVILQTNDEISRGINDGLNADSWVFIHRAFRKQLSRRFIFQS